MIMRILRAAGGTEVLAEQEGKQQKDADQADPNRCKEYAVLFAGGDGEHYYLQLLVFRSIIEEERPARRPHQHNQPCMKVLPTLAQKITRVAYCS